VESETASVNARQDRDWAVMSTQTHTERLTRDEIFTVRAALQQYKIILNNQSFVDHVKADAVLTKLKNEVTSLVLEKTGVS
jgi:hypothetical protein